MAETRFLKTVLFGGYERTGVEKRFEYLTTQLYSLKNELRENKLMLAELRKGTEAETAAEGILAGERAKLTQVQVQHEAMSKKVKVAEEDLHAKDEEIRELKEKLAALQKELDDKNRRLIAYESDSDASALSAVFIEAQKSAKLLVDNAKQEAETLEKNSRRLSENIVADANNSAKKIIYDAEVQSAETLANAENQSVQMEAVSDNLRASVLTDVETLNSQVASIQKMLEEFQQTGMSSLADSAKLLADAELRLKAGGVPVFRVPEPVVPQFPEEPIYEPVSYDYDAEPEEEDEAAALQKQQDDAELARLREMANAIGRGKKQKSEKNGKEEKQEKDSSVPDLAALAAQAAALKAKTK
ncbi:MAG: plectin [Oscillospiraceae bacterium]|nr:plectin [Oscillospiraceae bacterium]